MLKPIIFSTPMVQAIQEGRKTMTRRVIKPQPNTVKVDDKQRRPFAFYDGDKWIKCNYQPGDILWVRETWAPYATIDSWLDNENKYAYKADFQDKEVTWKWKPAIHMPREAARL